MRISDLQKCNLQVIRLNQLLIHPPNRVIPRLKIDFIENYEESIYKIKSSLTKHLMHKYLLRNEVIKIVMDTLSATDQYIDTIHPYVKLDDCIGANYIAGTFRYTNSFNQDTSNQEGRITLCIVFENVKGENNTIHAEDRYVVITDVGVYYEPPYFSYF